MDKLLLKVRIELLEQLFNKFNHQSSIELFNYNMPSNQGIIVKKSIKKRTLCSKII
jgi:hypothetical protein